MRWEGGEESSNVEDRRGMAPAAAGGLGLGGLALMAVVYFLTGDARVAQQAGNVVRERAEAPQGDVAPINDRTYKFTRVVIGFTEKVWEEQFRKQGLRYEKPKMVLFRDGVSTGGCGDAPSAVGPFYCPADRKVYLDPSFFEELEGKLGGSKAEFSQAYVIAHEVGHHIQNLLGYNRLTDEARRRGKRAGNEVSVRLELMADYLAGVWAHHGQREFNFIEAGDVESAIKTAQSIGDDRLQKKSQGWTSPESYTHGTSAQRTRYFQEGLKTGDFSKARLDRFFSAPYGEL